MRTLFNPLTVTADGQTVDNDLQGALIFLDAAKKGKYTADDIALALRQNNKIHLIEKLKSFGNCAESIEWHADEHKDHLINSYIGPDHRERYRSEVLRDTAEPAFTENLSHFLDQSLLRLYRADLSEINRDTSHNRHWLDIGEYDAAKDAIFMQRLKQCFEEMPDYYKILAEANQQLVIICTTRLLGGIQMLGAFGSASRDQIRLSFRDFCGENRNQAVSMLKEELMHSFDSRIGASKDPSFIRAAKSLLTDEAKMKTIEDLCQCHFPEKRAIRQYPENHHHAELFVSYFLIRDALCKNRVSENMHKWVKRNTAHNGDIRPDVNKRMAELFGQELHEYCVKAEASLRELAAAARTSTVNLPPYGS